MKMKERSCVALAVEAVNMLKVDIEFGVGSGGQ